MTDSNEQETKRPLTLARPGGRLELKRPLEANQVRQSFSHGRSKTVTVEVKKKRSLGGGLPERVEPASLAPAVAPARPVAPTIRPAQAPAADGASAPAPVAVPVAEIVAQPQPMVAEPVEARAEPAVPVVAEPTVTAPAAPAAEPVVAEPAPVVAPPRPRQGPIMTAPPLPTPVAPPAPVRAAEQPTRRLQPRTLTDEERAARVKALQSSIRAEEQARRQAEIDAGRRQLEAELARQKAEEEARLRAEEDAKRKAEDSKSVNDVEARRKADEDTKRQKVEDDSRREVAERAGKNAAAKVAALTAAGKMKPMAEEPEDAPKRGPGGLRTDARKTPVPARTKVDLQRRRPGKITISRALSDEDEERMRSLASVRRAREREKLRAQQMASEQVKVVRDVVVPEAITVADLANRMAERGTDVVRALMRIGVMATLNQTIDADTAELIVAEFGHNLRRVAESDVEIGLKGVEDEAETLEHRAPVVTIMGHVDHGKTSLLDALRATDVVSGEAGGITQHIGAYQVTMKTGQKITFIDTPGHQAFTAMRARGANVTDIVVLVVAADDGIKEQTVEAIRHARAANAPIIVAINKMDKPDADANRVRQALLQHEIVVESLGGEILDVEVSALKKTGLEKLEETILLQAELLDLRANPDRAAEGVVIEAKLERGRGAVATVLVQRGTLRVGDIFVAGSESGRVRALIDDKGESVKEAGPSMPIEVLGLNGAPYAGDEFSVVENEGRARDIADFRQRRRRDATAAAGARGTLEEMFTQIASGAVKEFPVVIKSDVQGSLEAILASIKGIGTDEVSVRVLHSAVGGINESDINLAAASKALVIGFNVRANPQARDQARRDGVEIRYYSIIYNVIDDMKQALSGMLDPTLREQFLGNASIREVFNITKVGKVAGCMITEGMVRRGAKVRLLREDVVIHEGSLKTLKRFKEEVREVREGYECGMAFENYTDIQVGDIIECFDIEEVARVL
ncbi:MAG TPA: translation initiation factor IF-2 [Stellaceae bacterium]|nr:translation initiation factor IF-2 [Stellaceae bacterium]